MRIALISTRVIAVLCVFVGSAFAQWLGYPTPGIPRTKDGKPNLTAPAPKTREGRPDLSGIWMMMYPKDVFARLVKEGVGPNLRDLMPEGTEIPLQPTAAALYKQRSDSLGKGRPSSMCLPHGIPDAMLVSVFEPFKLVQTPAFTIILFEVSNHYRQILTDGRRHPTDANPNFPDPQTLRRFLLQAPESFWKQMHMVNDRLLQKFIHLPDHRSRLIFDLDSTVVTVFGHQEHAAVGYNPRYRGKRSYNPLLCIEANSSYLWDTELRAGNASTWEGSPELLDTCFVNVPADIREIRLRADSGFGFNPVLEALEQRSVHYAVVARMTSG